MKACDCLLHGYNPKNWSGPWMGSVAIDQNDPIMENPETFNLTLERPYEFSTDYSAPSQIELDSIDLFSGLNLEQDYKLVTDFLVDPIEEQDEDIINQSNSNKVSNESFFDVNYQIDSENERKFGPESMRFIKPSEATSYSGLPRNSPLSRHSWLYDDKNNLRPKNWWMAEHNYCLVPDESTNETQVDVWGTSPDDNSSMLGSSKFLQRPKLATIIEAVDSTDLHHDVAGMNKLPRAKCFSQVSNPTSIMKDLQIALKTRSGSRRSARNIRPKGSVETTPSGSDFEDGCHMYTSLPERTRSHKYSVNRTSNKSLSEYNFDFLHLNKAAPKRMRSACRSANKLHPYQLDSEDDYSCNSNERPLKRTFATSQSVSRTSNQANRRALGRNVPKSTKKKTLKEKQGHKDNEKLRRDKLRDAFTNLRAEIPVRYLIRDNDKPSAMISKQKILNGAVTKSTEVLKVKEKLTKDFNLCRKSFKTYRKILARNRAQMSRYSCK
ncbi:BHLH domain-containing protein [Trichonephila clavata]|uniref:BHLH domain-containing protein n=1 Tax=Trichonephila clavata TaxID=2740835 RepID=A0A8X6F181_TRICU|nr:BHLH domain-containing protein [Trichonephila clavata]